MLVLDRTVAHATKMHDYASRVTTANSPLHPCPLFLLSWPTVYPADIISCKPEHVKPSCTCLRGDNCLFSDMRPTKILAAITAARAAGVTHIIEEGRYGGLSAYM